MWQIMVEKQRRYYNPKSRTLHPHPIAPLLYQNMKSRLVFLNIVWITWLCKFSAIHFNMSNSGVVPLYFSTECFILRFRKSYNVHRSTCKFPVYIFHELHWTEIRAHTMAKWHFNKTIYIVLLLSSLFIWFKKVWQTKKTTCEYMRIPSRRLKDYRTMVENACKPTPHNQYRLITEPALKISQIL